MAYYATALRRTLARTLSSQTRRHFTRSTSHRSLSRPISNPRPLGSTRTHFRFISSGPEPGSLSASSAKRVSEDDHGGDEEEELSGPPNWANPENIDDDTVLIDGCDFEHWVVFMRFPKDPEPSKEEMIQSYVSTVANAIGSEEEAKKKIYSVSTGLYTGFGVELSREVAETLKGKPNVLWVLPDSYMDVPSKDYGGDKYINGEVIPRPEFQAPVRQDHWISYSDDEHEKSPLDGFEFEAPNHLDGEDKMYEQLKRTIQKSKKEPPPIASERAEDPNLTQEEDETSRLFRKLREKVESMGQKSQSQTKESESGSTVELNQALSELKGDMKKTKIEPSEAQVVEEEEICLDWTDSEEEFFGNSFKHDPISSNNNNKPPLAFDKLMEEVKLFRDQHKDNGNGSDPNPNANPNRDPQRAFDGSNTHHSIFDRLKERLETVKRESGPKFDDSKRLPIERYSFDDEVDDVDQPKSDSPKST